MTDKKDDDYDIGYRKPPKTTQFKKGQSGNPSGRSKGKVKFTDVDSVLNDVLNALIPVNDNGRARKISKLRALLTQTVNKGLKGHHPSANLVLSQLAKRSTRSEPDTGEAIKADEDFKKEFEAYLDEIAENLSASSKAAPPQNDNNRDKPIVESRDASDLIRKKA